MAHQLEQYLLLLSLLPLLFSGGVFCDQRRQSKENKYELIVTREVCIPGIGCRTRREHPLPLLNNPVPVESETCPAPPPPTPPPAKPWFGKPELAGLILGSLAGILVTTVSVFIIYFLFVLVSTLIDERRN